jgi:hypothetical protein
MLLFVANPSEDDRTAVITLESGETLVDAQSGERFAGKEVQVPVSAWTVRLLEIMKEERC